MNGSTTSPARSRGGSTHQSGTLPAPTGGPTTQVMSNPQAHFSPSAADERQQMQALQATPPTQANDPAAFPLETTLQGHQRWVWDCAFSADSAYLVTACSDHFARLWELSTESIIRQYNGHHRGAVCVALNDTALT
jgi:target of rapamycin complex subunit LST8